MGTAWVCAPILISFQWKLPEVFLHRFRPKNHMISRLLFEKKGLKVSYFRKISIFSLKIHSLTAFKTNRNGHYQPLFIIFCHKLREYIQEYQNRPSEVPIGRENQHLFQKLCIFSSYSRNKQPFELAKIKLTTIFRIFYMEVTRI